MNALVFDTLRLAQKLEAAGFTPQQAQGAANAISEVLGEHVATQRDVQDIRRDIADLRKDLLETEARLLKNSAAETQALRADAAAETKALRADAAAEAKSLRADAAAEAKALRAEIREMGQQLTIRLGGMIAGALVVMAALVKLL